MKRLIAMATLLGAACLPAHAAEIEHHQNGNWYVGAYTNDQTGQFTHCAMSGKYRSGIFLTFAVGLQFEWSMGLGDPQWQLVPGTSYAVSFSVDGAPALHATATAVSKDEVQIPLPKTAALFQRMRLGRELDVFAAGRTMNFLLPGTSAALNDVLACTQRYVVQAQPNIGNPFVSNEKQSTRAAEQAEAAILIANVLSRSGIAGYKILGANELPPTPGNGYDAVWTMPGAMGTVTVLDNINDPNVARPGIVARDGKGCRGKFASSYLSHRDGSVGLYDACSSPNAEWEALYAFIPRRAGGLYMFQTVTSNQPIGTGRSVDAEIRQASHRVIGSP